MCAVHPTHRNAKETDTQIDRQTDTRERETRTIHAKQTQQTDGTQDKLRKQDKIKEVLRQIPMADLREKAHLSGREVKTLFS